MSLKKNAYASSATIRRAKSAIERAGSIVRSVKVSPDGAIEFLLASNDEQELSEFDRLETAGLL